MPIQHDIYVFEPICKTISIFRNESWIEQNEPRNNVTYSSTAIDYLIFLLQSLVLKKQVKVAKLLLIEGFAMPATRFCGMCIESSLPPIKQFLMSFSLSLSSSFFSWFIRVSTCSTASPYFVVPMILVIVACNSCNSAKGFFKFRHGLYEKDVS